jgi:hypothetical protein
MKLDNKGLIGTVVFHLLIVFLLIFFGFSYPDPPPEEEGILVNFGTDDTGYGSVEPAGDETQKGEAVSEPAVEISKEAVPDVTPQKESVKQTVTEQAQNFEKSPVVEKKPTAEEIRKQEVERQRIEALKKQQEEEERKRLQAEKLQQMGQSAFGNKGTGTQEGSEGITEGTGNQGSLSGQPGAENYGEGGGLGDGISYGLGNRKSRGQLPKPDINSCDVTSRIIIKVQIDVDQEGKVVGVPKVIESTYQDDCIYTAIIKAAQRSIFTTSETYRQRGWIQYIIEPAP